MIKMALLSIGLLASTAYAEPKYETMGVMVIRPSEASKPLTHDTLELHSPECKVTGIQLTNSESDIDIKYLGVKYENGDTEQILVREHFERNSSSGVRDLNGGERCITSVTLVGATGRDSAPSRIRVEVIHGGSRGEIHLGGTKLDFHRDPDQIRLSEPMCGIKALKLHVALNPVKVDFLSVTFANGETQRLDLKDVLKANSESRWMDFVGDERCISSVQIVGRTLTKNSRQESRVDVIGKQ